MRPVHRQRKYNPKRFTLGQFDANPYRYTQTKTGKRPFRVFQSNVTEETMYPGTYKRRSHRLPSRGRVDDLVRYRKHRHIIDAAGAHSDMKTIYKNVPAPKAFSRVQPTRYTYSRKGLTLNSEPFLRYMRNQWRSQHPVNWPKTKREPKQKLARKTGLRRLKYLQSAPGRSRFSYPELYGSWHNTGLDPDPDPDPLEWEGMFVPE